MSSCIVRSEKRTMMLSWTRTIKPVSPSNLEHDKKQRKYLISAIFCKINFELFPSPSSDDTYVIALAEILLELGGLEL